MRSSILRHLFSGIWRWKKGGRMAMSTSSSSSSSSSSSPWLMLPPGFRGDTVYNFYSLAEERHVSFSGEFELAEETRFVGSSHGWLAMFNPRRVGSYRCGHFLKDPVSERVISLPSTKSQVSRVVLSCSPDDPECLAVMSFGLGQRERLALCFPGRSTATAWTPFGTEDASYQDLVYSRKRECLFCITKSMLPYSLNLDEDLAWLEAWDLSNPERPRIFRKDPLPRLVKYCSGETEQRYLVFSEQSDQLYLVRRHMLERVGPDGNFVKDIYYRNLKAWDNSYPYKTVGFDVEIIDNNGKAAEVSSLDGMAIFIGINHGLVMEAAESRGLNANSIYFTDNTIHTPPCLSDKPKDKNKHDPRTCPIFRGFYVTSEWVDTVYAGHDIGIFDYNKKTFSPCFYPCDVQTLKPIQPPPLWFTPTIS